MFAEPTYSPAPSISPLAVIAPLVVSAPVTAKVEPSKVRFDSPCAVSE